MFQVGKTLISKDIFEKQFVCDLQACCGACCVEGESGAPLNPAEIDQLEAELDNIKPFMRPEGIEAVAVQGLALRDADGDWVTPLVEGRECAFVQFNAHGVAMCSIETAWKAGASAFRKPVSCHLYPIRITEYGNHSSLNYHRWDVCGAACSLGEQLGMSVFRFARTALLRKYGAEWVAEAEEVEKQWNAQKSGRAESGKRGLLKK